MLDVWLIPVMVILALVIGGFYVAIRLRGGDGVRTEGRTLCDKPAGDDEDSSN